MRRASALVVIAALAAGCGGTRTVTRTVTVAPPVGPAPPAERVDFGYLRSLTRHGDGWLLRFDPAWFLSGITANTAAAEDGVIPPGQPVPNDNYRLDEGRRALTYAVPADARVTVLARGVSGTRITVAQLAQLLRGRNPLGRRLFEPLSTGFWLRYRIDTVESLDQQYIP